jgi:hypothetical protein
MKRVFLLILAGLLLAATFSCSWFNRQEVRAWETVENLISTADAKVSAWCDVGYLPAQACAEWADLKTELGDKLADLKDKWAGIKDKIIDYLIRFISGKLGPILAAPADGKSPTWTPYPDPADILAAAETANKEGKITDADLAALKAAAEE